MNPGEHAIMARVEAEHWWYVALRDLIGRLLRAATPSLPEHPRVLDAGCGTGANLAFLESLLEPSYLGGFDVSDEAVAFASGKVPSADIYRSDLCDPELHAAGLDLVTSLDVLYIPGVERARAGLQRIVSNLRPGGRLLLNLPAHDWLYSEHDVAVHTRERYTRAGVLALLDSIGLEVEWISYRLCLLFPLVLGTRLPSMLRARRMRPEDARSDLHGSSNGLANGPLLAAMKLENQLIARGISMPVGSSIFAIARKPAG